ncbi:MAG TPA: hypothetical protein DCQ64_07215 [Candidatus Rokubacteria bacterium]|nr:hypothetical protein [Candidatus Rokubacteria bacterium]
MRGNPINQKKFDSLTPVQQKALVDAAAQVKVLAGQWARDKVNTSAAEVENAGVHIYRPAKDEMAQWLSVRESVWQAIAGEFKGGVRPTRSTWSYVCRSRSV